MMRFSGLLILGFLFNGCKHEPIKPSNNVDCVEIPLSGTPHGYTYVLDTIGFHAPNFNPVNPNEFCYIEDNPQTYDSRLVVFNLASKAKKLLAKDILYCPRWGSKGKIVFDGRDNNIRTADPVTLQVTQLTFGKDSYNPYWSPDSKCIVFQRKGQVFVMNENGAEVKPLFDSVGFFSHPVWSPDGSKIALAQGVNGGTRLVIFDTADHTFNIIGMTSTGGDLVYEWLPDSKNIAWITQGGIFIYSLDSTRKLIKKACSSKGYIWLSISKDGEDILFDRVDYKIIGKDSLHVETNLYIMNADGSDERKVEF